MHAAGKVEVLVASIDNDSSKELIEPQTFFNGGTDDVAINSTIAISENSCTNTNILAGTSMKLHGTRMGCPAADMKGNGPSNGANSQISEAIDNNSKPRTALFQGGEDDELMAPQNIAANVIVNNGKDSIILDSNSPTNPLLIKIGELCFDVKHDEEEKFLAAVSSVQPHMLIFKEINLCKQVKKFLQNGSMQVEIKHAETPG